MLCLSTKLTLVLMDSQVRRMFDKGRLDTLKQKQRPIDKERDKTNSDRMFDSARVNKFRKIEMKMKTQNCQWRKNEKFEKN